MPSKYSHGLVLSQHQYRSIIHTDRPLSLKPPSSRDSRSQTRSNEPSIRCPSTYSTQSSVYSDYLRLEPDPEPEASYDYRSSTPARYPPIESTSSNTPRSESTFSQPSRLPSDRLRLESPFGFRIEDPPSPPPKVEPTPLERPNYELTPPHGPNSESPIPERLRLGTPLPLRLRDPRPSLHHKSSSVETQIYAPEPTASPPPPRDRPHLSSLETNERSPSPPPTRERQHHSPLPSLQGRQNSPSYPFRPEFRHPTSPAFLQERQHVSSMDSPESSPPPTSTGARQYVFSMESPESFPPPISTGNRRERFSSEIQSAYLPSSPRDRRQSLIKKTEGLASPSPVQGRQPHSPFGTQDSPLFPSARELQDYFSIETQGSKSTPAAIGDRQDVVPIETRSALPASSQDAQVRPSLDTQRLQSPSQTQDRQRRPSLGTRHFSSERRTQTMQESIHGRRQSIDSQTTRDRQDRPSLGLRHISLDRFIKDTKQSRRQSIDTKTTQERQSRPSLSSQQISLEEFIQESDHIREPSIDSHVYSPQSSLLYSGKSNSRQTALADGQRYTPKSTLLQHSPRSRRDRPSKLPDTFASRHRILLPTSHGAYDNVSIETHGFPPERPPSPPATPDSSKSFSLTPQAEEPQRIRPPPPIPQRSARRSPPRQRSILRSTNSSVVYLPSEPPRPRTSSVIAFPNNSRTSTALHSSKIPISKRRSSVNATMTPPSVSFSDFSETMTSPRRVSFSQSRDREYFEDADLDYLSPEIDFNVLPHEDPNTGPAVFRATQLGLENAVSPRYEEPNAGPALFNATQLGLGRPGSRNRPVSSRTSSFDSAAPPPIGLNRRISHAIAEPYQPRMPKKESKMSLLSFLRSTPAPKAVLYSEATQGKPPVPVSVSRTAAPSIPLLFPGYRGQFPPPQKMQDKGLRPGLEPRLKAGSDARASARSTAHTDAAEKRKSWFKGDEVDKSHGASRPVKRGELERILSNL
ncbi:MAG: hypothetical protein ASARMPREDX12_004552 [Alectoria sarmentosa]|nr:MAG: hypothetical protein ASARMPREDX12_004552 [Alectoria sarmentosa]CAD6575004.1 MAG: hypothetical protein ASARMPRED_007020 [Alectoria sarmentosa]